MKCILPFTHKFALQCDRFEILLKATIMTMSTFNFLLLHNTILLVLSLPLRRWDLVPFLAKSADLSRWMNTSVAIDPDVLESATIRVSLCYLFESFACTPIPSKILFFTAY